MQNKIVSSFYKYVQIENPQEFQKWQLDLCKSLHLKGRILIGEEGINGSVFGSRCSIEAYKLKLKSNASFKDIEFKEQETNIAAFRKLYVGIKKEIVHFGARVELQNAADYITPIQLKDLLDGNEDITLVDLRNEYETRIGNFKGARTLSMENFRNLPEHLSEIKDLKEKKIVTYCTGGIRCEKASAFLKENGFKNVFQLKGGILNFVKEFPDTYWQGKCFVFDDRLAVSLNQKGNPINDCAWCKTKADNYVNCHNLECDKLFICCENCINAHKSSCCSECEESHKRRKTV